MNNKQKMKSASRIDVAISFTCKMEKIDNEKQINGSIKPWE